VGVGPGAERSRLMDYRGSRSRWPTRRPTRPSAACWRYTLPDVDANADPKLIHAKASMAKLFVSEAAGAVPTAPCRRSAAVLHALERRRALPTRAACRPHLGGHQRDPAADRRALARAPWRPRRRSIDDPRHRTEPSAAIRPPALIRPNSVAVVGATERPGSYAAEALLTCRSSASPVGVGREPRSPRGLRAPVRRALLDLPEPVDAVLGGDPAVGVPATIEQAGERGCGGAVVISAGFAEGSFRRGAAARAGRGGRPPRTAVCRPQLQRDRLTARARGAVGDALQPTEPGSVALISQSGNVAVNALAARRGLRFHT